jgi:SpoVK/Ycf46/Vps4 family AAA+-type ATPase
LIQNLLKGQKVKLNQKELYEIAECTENYSGSDLNSLCKETAMVPIRELGSKIMELTIDQIRGIDYNDFLKSIKHIKPSATKETIIKLQQWNKEFGNF